MFLNNSCDIKNVSVSIIYYIINSIDLTIDITINQKPNVYPFKRRLSHVAPTVPTVTNVNKEPEQIQIKPKDAEEERKRQGERKGKRVRMNVVFSH